MSVLIQWLQACVSNAPTLRCGRNLAIEVDYNLYQWRHLLDCPSYISYVAEKHRKWSSPLFLVMRTVVVEVNIDTSRHRSLLKLWHGMYRLWAGLMGTTEYSSIFIGKTNAGKFKRHWIPVGSPAEISSIARFLCFDNGSWGRKANASNLSDLPLASGIQHPSMPTAY